MIELALLGSHADGTQLVFTDPDGKRYLVDIDDDLKAAIRRQSLSAEVLPPPGRRLAPREIQRLLRAGMEPEEIASAYEIELERINRYTTPVQLEKNFVISRALEAPISSDSGAPRLGELVVDRLATRGVDAASLSWSARREDGLPWELHLNFAQAARQLHAHWEISESGKLQRALDDEARWLTETTSPATPPVSTLVTSAPATVGQAQSDESVEALLDELSAARGRRQGLDSEDDQPPLRMDAARQRSESGKPEFKPTSPLRFVRYSRGDKSAASLTSGAENTGGNSATADSGVTATPGDSAAGTRGSASPAADSAVGSSANPDEAGRRAGPAAAESADSSSPYAGFPSGNVADPSNAANQANVRQNALTAEDDTNDTAAAGADTASTFPSGEAEGTGPWEGADSGDTDAGVLPGLGDLPEDRSAKAAGESVGRRSKRAKRRSVPAWDEIIFGSRSDQ